MATIVNDILAAPCTSIYAAFSLWIYVKLSIRDYDIKSFQISYADCIIEKAWWRILTAPCANVTFLHLVVNITTAWSIRYIEFFYGSFYVLRYSILMMVFDAVAMLTLFYGVIKISGINVTSNHPLRAVSTYSLSSILLGWLGFLSIDFLSKYREIYFFILGVIPIPLSLSPIVVLLLIQCVAPKAHFISHASGLVGGYLLALGVIAVLPDTYWTLCIFFDLLLYVIWWSRLSDATPDLESGVLEIRQYNFGEVAENDELNNEGPSTLRAVFDYHQVEGTTVSNTHRWMEESKLDDDEDNVV